MRGVGSQEGLRRTDAAAGVAISRGRITRLLRESVPAPRCPVARVDPIRGCKVLLVDYTSSCPAAYDLQLMRDTDIPLWCISVGGSKVRALLWRHHNHKNYHAFNVENRALVSHGGTAPPVRIAKSCGDRGNPRQPWRLFPSAAAEIFRKGFRS
jgi:hypothetical protein